MRKAIIVIKQKGKMMPGQILEIKDSEELNLEWYGPESERLWLEVKEVPSELDFAEEHNITTENIDGEWVLKPIKSEKDLQIEELVKEMYVDLYARAKNTFGTRNIAAIASIEWKTWTLMKENPAEWSSLGLLSDFDTGNFSKGDPLDTDQKVSDYATSKLEEMKEYLKYRMQRIGRFKKDREPLLNE